MKFPIIIINYGNPWYLKYSLSQCIGTNANARVILIGDKSNYGYKGLEHYLAEDYTQYANQFSTIYTHLSTNEYKFELFCIQRWFILYEFMKKNNINQCFIMDSDVLLYDKVEKYKNSLGDKQINLFIDKNAYVASAGNSYILSQEFLLSFLEFVMKVYKNKTSHEFTELVDHYNKLQNAKKMGGVCDMSLWYQFSLINTDKVFDGYTSIENNCYFDINTASKDSPFFTFEYNETLKKINFKGSIPYIKIITPNIILLRAICLHFQGSIKKQIPKYITYKGFYYLYNCYWIEFKNKIKSIYK